MSTTTAIPSSIRTGICDIYDDDTEKALVAKSATEKEGSYGSFIILVRNRSFLFFFIRFLCGKKNRGFEIPEIKT